MAGVGLAVVQPAGLGGGCQFLLWAERGKPVSPMSFQSPWCGQGAVGFPRPEPNCSARPFLAQESSNMPAARTSRICKRGGPARARPRPPAFPAGLSTPGRGPSFGLSRAAWGGLDHGPTRAGAWPACVPSPEALSKAGCHGGWVATNGVGGRAPCAGLGVRAPGSPEMAEVKRATGLPARRAFCKYLGARQSEGSRYKAPPARGPPGPGTRRSRRRPKSSSRTRPGRRAARRHTTPQRHPDAASSTRLRSLVPPCPFHAVVRPQVPRIPPDHPNAPRLYSRAENRRR